MQRIVWPVLALAWAVLTWYLTSTPQIVVTDQQFIQAVLMMGAHFFFFGIQAVLLLFSLSSLFTIHYSLFISAISLLAASLYGAFIEYLQLSVPGRSADPADWALDTIGALVFLAIIKKLNIKSEF